MNFRSGHRKGQKIGTSLLLTCVSWWLLVATDLINPPEPLLALGVFLTLGVIIVFKDMMCVRDITVRSGVVQVSDDWLLFTRKKSIVLSMYPAIVVVKDWSLDDQEGDRPPRYIPVLLHYSHKSMKSLRLDDNRRGYPTQEEAMDVAKEAANLLKITFDRDAGLKRFHGMSIN